MAKFILSAFADEAGSSLDEQIQALKANGIDYIEPRNINSKPILTLTDEELHEVRRALDENGITVGSLGSPIGKYPIDQPFEKHLEDFRRALDVCDILGTKNIRMFSFFVEQDSLAEHREEVIRRLKVLCDMAEQRGIRLCHENESRIYGQMPCEVRDILTAVPSLGGIFDPANYRMNNADVIDGIEATMVNFAYMHIKDAHFETQTILPAGEGEGKIPEILDIVNSRVDGTVMLTLEPHLAMFDAYKGIDDHELKGRHAFASRREAFDFAAQTLKNVLKDRGYERNGNNEWIK